MKSRFFFGVQACQLVNSFLFRLARQASDQLADGRVWLAVRFRQNCGRLLLQRFDFGRQLGLYVLAGLCQPGEDAERERRVGYGQDP